MANEKRGHIAEKINSCNRHGRQQIRMHAAMTTLGRMLLVLAGATVRFVCCDEIGQCSTAYVRPKAGLCYGESFTYKICTGNLQWYRFDIQTLTEQIQQLIPHLESFTWKDCNRWICKELLNSTVSVRAFEWALSLIACDTDLFFNRNMRT